MREKNCGACGRRLGGKARLECANCGMAVKQNPLHVLYENARKYFCSRQCLREYSMAAG
ncbi:MAG: hypothetical protein AB1626_05430 [Candidatus Micrarchaeota archaeon]